MVKVKVKEKTPHHILQMTLRLQEELQHPLLRLTTKPIRAHLLAVTVALDVPQKNSLRNPKRSVIEQVL